MFIHFDADNIAKLLHIWTRYRLQCTRNHITASETNWDSSTFSLY